jgi:hypothetical protein
VLRANDQGAVRQQHAVDFAQKSRSVRHVVVRQSAHDDVDRLAFDPGERILERVDAEGGTVADTCPCEVDHRR